MIFDFLARREVFMEESYVVLVLGFLFFDCVAQMMAFVTIFEVLVFAGWGLYQRLMVSKMSPLKLSLVAIYILVLSCIFKGIFFIDPFGHYDILPLFLVNVAYWVETMLSLTCVLLTISVWCSVLYSTKNAKALSLNVPRYITMIAGVFCGSALVLALVLGIITQDQYTIRNICVVTTFFLGLFTTILLSIFLPLTSPILKENISNKKKIRRSFKYLTILLISQIAGLIELIAGVFWRIVTTTYQPIHIPGYNIMVMIILLERFITHNTLLFLLLDPLSRRDKPNSLSYSKK